MRSETRAALHNLRWGLVVTGTMAVISFSRCTLGNFLAGALNVGVATFVFCAERRSLIHERKTKIALKIISDWVNEERE